jgi:hypothetical protein
MMNRFEEQKSIDYMLRDSTLVSIDLHHSTFSVCFRIPFSIHQNHFQKAQLNIDDIEYFETTPIFTLKSSRLYCTMVILRQPLYHVGNRIFSPPPSFIVSVQQAPSQQCVFHQHEQNLQCTMNNYSTGQWIVHTGSVVCTGNKNHQNNFYLINLYSMFMFC